MDKKQAWEGVFSLVAPAGFDLDEAASVLDGVQELDAGVTLEASIKGRAAEFLMEPDAFIAANSRDLRVPLWTRLATSLGAASAPSSSTTPPAATPPAIATPAATSPPPPAATPAPAKGLSPSGLRKAMVAAAAGPSLAGVKVATGTPAGSPSAKADDPSGGGKPPPKPKQPKGAKRTAATGTADGGAGTTTSEPPDDDHRSPTGDTGGHDRTSRQHQRRRDYALTVAEVFRELAALVVEDDDALERRLAIETAADIRRRVYELKIADEQRKRDAAAADVQRRRDEEAAERKRKADEEAEERKLRRRDEAEERKRLEEQAREKAEAEAARPRPSRVAQRVPVSLIATLQSQPYLAQRDRALNLARRAREGDATARVDLDALVASLRQAVRSMAPGYQVVASAELQLSLIEAVEAGRDKTEATWFQANFVTGSY